MNAQLEASRERLQGAADQFEAGARRGIRGLIQLARQRGQQAADAVAEGKRPLETLSGIGLKLSAVSHRTTDRVVKQQTRLAANQLDLIAERLEQAADASCLRDLIARQWRLTPAQFGRLGSDARESLAIIAGGGAEARDVVKEAIAGLRSAGNASPAKKAKPAAKKARRKTTTTRKKSTASKRRKKVAAAAKKPVARKAPARKKTARKATTARKTAPASE